MSSLPFIVGSDWDSSSGAGGPPDSNGDSRATLKQRGNPGFPLSRTRQEDGQDRTEPWSALVCLLTLLSGCTVGPNYVPSTINIPAGYKEMDGWKVARG
jgi:hypothetical protein